MQCSQLVADKCDLTLMLSILHATAADHTIVTLGGRCEGAQKLRGRRTTSAVEVLVLLHQVQMWRVRVMGRVAAVSFRSRCVQNTRCSCLLRAARGGSAGSGTKRNAWPQQNRYRISVVRLFFFYCSHISAGGFHLGLRAFAEHEEGRARRESSAKSCFPFVAAVLKITME